MSWTPDADCATPRADERERDDRNTERASGNLSPIFPFIIWGQAWPTALFCIQSKTTGEVHLDDNETRISGIRHTDVTNATKRVSQIEDLALPTL